jgi:hypothetical protein
MDNCDTQAAAQNGYADATRLVAAHHAAGASLDQIAEHHTDTAITLLNDAKTAIGRAYAVAYGETAAASIADLRSQAQAHDRPQARPATLPPASPGFNADQTGAAARYGENLRSPQLAAWENGGRVTGAGQLAHLIQAQRTGQHDLDRETMRPAVHPSAPRARTRTGGAAAARRSARRIASGGLAGLRPRGQPQRRPVWSLNRAREAGDLNAVGQLADAARSAGLTEREISATLRSAERSTPSTKAGPDREAG